MITSIENMEPVAFSQGVTVYCPKNGKFSFFNSPYPMHTTYSAVDIYCKSFFGCIAASPVYGEVVKIRQVRCQEKKNFSSRDYVILLRSLENPEMLVKLLHVEPAVEVGDEVRPGDDLGFFLRSGFFDFWTEPHVHVEVRNPSDPIRATGGHLFEVLFMPKIKTSMLEKLAGTVIECKDEYALVDLDNSSEHGTPVDLNGSLGFLDGGLPHYKMFGIHMAASHAIGGTVNLCGTKIGTVKFVYGNMCIAQCSNLTFKIKGKPVKLAFFVHLSKPFLKVIPYKIGELELEEFEKVSVTIS